MLDRGSVRITVLSEGRGPDDPIRRVVIAGRPGMGETARALEIARDVLQFVSTRLDSLDQ